MIARQALDALGIDDSQLERARTQGLVVGRGEGFVSREWRPGGGLIVSVHADESGDKVVCAQPLLALLPRTQWTLAAVAQNAGCVHCATARLEAGSLQLQARLPDFAARRNMFPLGLAAQAQIFVVIEELSASTTGEAVLVGLESERVRVSGRVLEATPFTNEASGVALRRLKLDVGGRNLIVAGRGEAEVVPGDWVSVDGWAVVRVGAPMRTRGVPE